jgi:hypothetical protein
MTNDPDTQTTPDVTDEKVATTLLGCALSLLALIGVLVTIPLAICYEGWILATLWGWFVVQLGAPQITVAHAIGLSCVADMFLAGILKTQHNILTIVSPDINKMPIVKRLKVLWSVICVMFYVPTIILGIAWIVQHYM